MFLDYINGQGNDIRTWIKNGWMNEFCGLLGIQLIIFTCVDHFMKIIIGGKVQ